MPDTATPLPPDCLLDDDIVALRPRLCADDATVRRLALIELAEWEDAVHLPWLRWALQHDADEAVRAEAADRLANWEQPETVAALVAALRDPAAAVRVAAAHSLTELKDVASGVELLEAARASSDVFVQASALRALRELRLPEAFDPALAAAASPDAAVRLEAVGVLGWLKNPAALPVLTQRAQHDAQDEVRRAAVGALGLAADDAVLPALLTALRDAAWQVREEAATTLGKLKLPGAVEALIAALADDYWQVRQRAARALGRLKDPRAVAPLVSSALTHASANLRKEAAIALGEIGDPSAAPALEQSSRDPDPDVRKASLLALKLVGRRADGA